VLVGYTSIVNISDSRADRIVVGERAAVDAEAHGPRRGAFPGGGGAGGTHRSSKETPRSSAPEGTGAGASAGVVSAATAAAMAMSGSVKHEGFERLIGEDQRRGSQRASAAHH